MAMRGRFLERFTPHISRVQGGEYPSSEEGTRQSCLPNGSRFATVVLENPGIGIRATKTSGQGGSHRPPILRTTDRSASHPAKFGTRIPSSVEP